MNSLEMWNIWVEHQQIVDTCELEAEEGEIREIIEDRLETFEVLRLIMEQMEMDGEEVEAEAGSWRWTDEDEFVLGEWLENVEAAELMVEVEKRKEEMEGGGRLRKFLKSGWKGKKGKSRWWSFMGGIWCCLKGKTD